MSGTGELVMHKTYQLVCQLPAQIASERIEALLSKEGVKYTTANLSVASTRTPITVLGIQPKLYSRSNWVGVNPFTFVSGVQVQCEQGDSEVTKVTVRVNRLRAFLWVAFWIACSFLAARAMPEPGGAILVVVVACAAWFGIVSFLGGYLVKKEISDRLKDQ
ncbi:MAG: hypothetical protein ACRD4R_17650 [Candidatus Acidiferrales bacterium]